MGAVAILLGKSAFVLLFQFFHSMALRTVIGFTDLLKCTVVLSNLALPASWYRATKSSTCKVSISHHLHANRLPLPRWGAGQRDYSFSYLFTQFLLHIYSWDLQGKALVLCISLSHIHPYGNVVIQLSTWSLPSAVTSSLDRG